MASWMLGQGKQYGRVLMLWTVGLALCLAAQMGHAQVVEERPDVRVIIDVSGSMQENDPEQLSTSALELLVSLLPWGVDAGVWTFGEKVDNPLPLGRVDAAWRDEALALSPALQANQPHTDIETALREAASAKTNGWRHMVLLTDGMIDLPSERGAKPAIDDQSRQRLVEELAPEFANQGVVVHSVAFSDQVDLALMERVSQLTGGLSSMVASPESLLGAFLDIFERIFPADQVPLIDGRFTIDPDVESFSALLFHEPDDGAITLVAPDGSTYLAERHADDMRWQVEPRFDLIRVPNPASGEWRLEGPTGSDSRINVISPLALRTNDLPTTLYLGFEVPVEAWIELDGEPAAELAEDLDVTMELHDAQGEVQTAIQLQPRDGRFAGVLPPPAITGNSKLVIRAEGENFHRQRIQAVNVLPAIGLMHQPRAERVLLVAEHPRLDRHNTELSGELQGKTLEADALGPTRWHLSLPEIDDSVRLPLLVTARVTLDGESREIRLPRLILNPDGRIGIDLADEVGPTLSTERLEEEPSAEDTTEWADNAADRFVSIVNELPRRAWALWQEGWPGLERMVEQSRQDPWWRMATLMVVILLLVGVVAMGLRHRTRSVPAPKSLPGSGARPGTRSRSRPATQRKEPYV
ncbi:VWA domain-containing protein [Halomonas sp. TRM85114]|uniref:VWA domain-containing protein n=1 Tax=Halomonas jincaotanensis TaxID=2810616 RepID=UPI001BD479F9|nr:vWA domain-containing protein [Halomonas jincaotanensis]MBS9403921.1 VWA domain-containing protein [Halomonas jincaotanensis]